jgi:branched-chain amino acid transport system ATP-binding protein
MTLLDVSRLTVRYGAVTAVDSLDFVLESDEVLVVLGSNGAGKTSSMRGIVNAHPKAGGSVIFGGTNITGWSTNRIARAGLGMVPEGRRIFGPLTVEENLLLGGYQVRSRSVLQQRMDEMFDLFPILRERRATNAGFLSGGEQQMLAFGRALMSRPRALLLDEPSVGLSPAMVDRIMASVKEISKTGISIVLVEQNAVAALSVADRGLVLDRGRVRIRGTAAELKTHPEVVRAFLGDRAAAQEAATKHAIGSASGARP